MELKSRGQTVTLPHGGLPEVISPHLIALIKKTGGANGPIGRQFVAQPNLECKYFRKMKSDPLDEDHNEVAPGLVYKYQGKINKKGEIIRYGRALWTVTRFCGSYCRFCTRGREVGMMPNSKKVLETHAALSSQPFLTDNQIEKAIEYIVKHPEINEIVLSGGDPLTSQQAYLTKIIDRLVALQKKGQLHIIRVGSRLPIHNPIAVQDWQYALLARIKNPYLMVHINHSAELTPETLVVLNRFRKESLATVMSQSVFLKGVNDDEKTLIRLFNALAKEGIRPYYMFQNDPVYWAKHLTVPIKRGIALWQKIRPQLSGVAATVRYVIDVPDGYGKIPVPEGGAWKFDASVYHDFRKKVHKT